MANQFTVTIPAKSYVKAYLENTCGVPVNLRCLPEIQSELLRALERKTTRYENKDLYHYTEEVTIVISGDNFYRYGWEMNKTQVGEFNRYVERKIKTIMRSYVAMHKMVGIPTATSIRDFQEKFNLHEQVWPFESIKKDFNRHFIMIEHKPANDLKQKISEIILENLSVLGTVGRKQKYEKYG